MYADIREIPNMQAVCMRLVENGVALRFQQFAERLSQCTEFPTFLSKTLAECEYEGFRWELPALTQANWIEPFECVLVESRELIRPANSSPFEEHFVTDRQVVAFANLRGDATLVVPTPIGTPDAYPHLAAFVRGAPTTQQHLLWQTVGEVLVNRISEKPVWLSTAGSGVAWLHVRLDDRPKYYSYGPYRAKPGV